MVSPSYKKLLGFSIYFIGSVGMLIAADNPCDNACRVQIAQKALVWDQPSEKLNCNAATGQPVNSQLVCLAKQQFQWKWPDGTHNGSQLPSPGGVSSSPPPVQAKGPKVTSPSKPIKPAAGSAFKFQ